MLADCFDIPIKQRCHLISGQPYSFASFVNYNGNRDLSVVGFEKNNLIAIHFRAPHQSIGHMHVQFDTRLSAELYGCRPAGARTCLRVQSDDRRKYSIHLADTYHWGPPHRLTLPVYLDSILSDIERLFYMLSLLLLENLALGDAIVILLP